jgi:hypothetical protein
MTPQEHIQSLAEIRSLMERSQRFISLSGLSGVAAGVVALMGAAAMYWYLQAASLSVGTLETYEYVNRGGAEMLLDQKYEPLGLRLESFILLNFSAVLFLALSMGMFFTWRRMSARQEKIITPASLKLALHLAVPLAAGGIFCLILLCKGHVEMVAPATLVFYGLALLNGSKYTLDDIRNLGYCEIVLGLLGMVFTGWGLALWALGFGVLHILYGLLMYRKYER